MGCDMLKFDRHAKILHVLCKTIKNVQFGFCKDQITPNVNTQYYAVYHNIKQIPTIEIPSEGPRQGGLVE